MKLLLVEDDFDLSAVLSAALKNRGFQVLCLASGLEALTVLRKSAFDVVVLDLTLPDLDGLELLQRLRGDGNTVPVLALTARGAVVERIAGLQGGADDYLAKPFDLEELAARLQALTRRLGRNGELRCGLLRYDSGKQIFFCQSVPLDLSPRECELLRVLMASVDQVVPKELLRDSIFSGRERVSIDAIDVLMHRLRKKLGSTCVEILTLRGVGYMLCDDASSAAQRMAS